MAENLRTTASVDNVFSRIISLITSATSSKLVLSRDLISLQETSTHILAFVRHAADSGICLNENWLMMLQELAHDAADLLEELNYGILQHKLENQKQRKNYRMAAFNILASDQFRDIQMERRIRAINKTLEDQIRPAGVKEGRLSYGNDLQSSVDSDRHPAPRFVGRDFELQCAVKILTKQIDVLGPILPIVGTGGIGKTSLAWQIYNHEQIKRHFDKRIWVSASGDFEATRMLKLTLEALIEKPAANHDTILKLQVELRGRRCLLVLDNVFEGSVYEEWEEFLDKFFMEIKPELDSWLLVTTRMLNKESFERHALLPKSLELEPLSADDCFSIFKQYAFGSEANPESITTAPVFVRDIIHSCGGVPLAAKLLGSMYKAKREWSSDLEFLPESMGDMNQVTNFVFHQLPSLSLKKCFAYCSILPKDFCIEKHRLVELWIAEGCIQPDKGTALELEDIGYNIFNSLVKYSLFQDIKKDEYGNITHCKLHDLLHDLAQALTSIADFNPAKDFKREIPAVKHLTLHSFWESTISDARMVRTLFLRSKIPDSRLSDFRFLHTLNISSTDVESLPAPIEKLIHLRYLGLAGTRIKYLPDSICKLYKLQTLRLKNCQSLKELPKEFEYLISLRHLHFLDDEQFCMPPRIGQLTCLQTLLFFNLGKGKGHRIDEIGHLKNLRGKIAIRNLELVKDDQEAELADIFGKTEVYKLEYQWNDNGKGNDNHEKVLEGLQPHPEIKSLTVRNYNSDKLPSWVLQMSVSVNNMGGSLNKLIEVRLLNCKNCQLIPMLWQLPLLHYLELKGLNKVTSICSSYFFNSDTSSQHISRSGHSTWFPALKILKLDSMPNLERWIDIDETPRTEMFPFLEKLCIDNCPRLTTIHHNLPSLKELKIKIPFIFYSNIQVAKMCGDVTTLMELQIHGLSELTCLPDGLLHCNVNLEILRLSSCPNLTHIVPTICDSNTSLRELSIRGCEHFTKLPEGVNNLSCLEILSIEECPNFRCFPDLIGDGQLTLLRHLKIAYCDALTHLPHEMIASCPNLRSLRVSHCSSMISFAFDLDRMSCVSFLWISNCPQWTSAPEWLGHLHCLSELRIGKFSDMVQFHSFKACLDVLQYLPTFYSLRLYGWQQWTSLPDEVQHLSGLRTLHVTDFGIEALPDWLEELPYLEELCLYSCKKLKYMPSPISMKQCTALRRVSIFGCPLVRKSCTQSGWSSSAFELRTDWAENVDDSCN